MKTKAFKTLKYLIVGIFFGIIMTKSEIISWYRIQEMFRFDSFHMYGIIGTAISLGMLGIFLIKKLKVKNVYGEDIVFTDKNRSIPRYLIGGIIFGLGWAVTGVCPGPVFVLLGHGYTIFLVTLLSAVIGTFVYGLLRDKLPH